MAPAEYSAATQGMVEAIPATLDPSHRSALKNRIKYGYQYSLRKRMGELLRFISAEALTVLEIDGEHFAEDVVNARNEFTHWNPQPENPPPGAAELAAMVTKLHAFSWVVVLKHIGVPETLSAPKAWSNRARYTSAYVRLLERGDWALV